MWIWCNESGCCCRFSLVHWLHFQSLSLKKNSTCDFVYLDKLDLSGCVWRRLSFHQVQVGQMSSQPSNHLEHLVSLHFTSEEFLWGNVNPRTKLTQRCLACRTHTPGVRGTGWSSCPISDSHLIVRVSPLGCTCVCAQCRQRWCHTFSSTWRARPSARRMCVRRRNQIVPQVSVFCSTPASQRNPKSIYLMHSSLHLGFHFISFTIIWLLIDFFFSNRFTSLQNLEDYCLICNGDIYVWGINDAIK